MLSVGCATAQTPSPADARQPTPASVTRDNPGGDAPSPIDAALERLLAEPLGKKIDRWGTLAAHFHDHTNWKRVRFWGYPTRAGFRYGKNPHIAVGMVSYTEAKGDDSPEACLEGFVKKARATANLFDVEVGEVHREVRPHKHGPERVNWEQQAAEWEIEKQRRIEERKARVDKLREQKRKRLRKARERWKKLRQERSKRRAEKAAAEAGENQTAGKTIPKSSAAAADPSAQSKPAQSKPAQSKPAQSKPAQSKPVMRPRRLLRPIQKRATSPAKANNTKDNAAKKAPAEKTPPTQPQTAEERKRQKARNELRSEQRAVRERIAAHPHRRVPMPKEIPPGEMIVLRSSGKFNTLLMRESYEVAVVAYESWPGTCLVQGFAARVGSDVMLARRVVTRWVDEAAPIFRWYAALREAPPFANR